VGQGLRVCALLVSATFPLAAQEKDGEQASEPEMRLTVAATPNLCELDKPQQRLQGEPVRLYFTLHNVAAEKISWTERTEGWQRKFEAEGRGEELPEPAPLPVIVIPHRDESWSRAVEIGVDKQLDPVAEAAGEPPVVRDWLAPSTIEAQRLNDDGGSYGPADGRLAEAPASFSICLSPTLGAVLTPGTYIVRATYDTLPCCGDAAPRHVEAAACRFTVRAPATAAERAYVCEQTAFFWRHKGKHADAFQWLSAALAIDPGCREGYGELTLAEFAAWVGDTHAQLAAYDSFIDRVEAGLPPGGRALANGYVLKERNDLAARLSAPPRVVELR